MVSRFHLRGLIFVCFILITFLLFPSLTIAKEPIRNEQGTVVKVIDGDTVHVITANKTKLKIRLYGIDAPETPKINRKTGVVSKQGQPYGEEAYEVLKDKTFGKKVRIEIMDIDRYKRMVAVLRIGNRNINQEMVIEGWAWAYRQYLDRPYASEYIRAEETARAKKLGLWNQANPQPPWEFRKLMKYGR